MSGRKNLLKLCMLLGASFVLFYCFDNEFLVKRNPEQAVESSPFLSSLHIRPEYDQTARNPESKAKLETCNSRFIFIDLGANRADSLRVFLKEPDTKFQFDFPKPPLPCAYSDAEIYLFEANPVFNVDLVRAKQEFMIERNPPAAKKIDLFTSTIVWIEDTTMSFYLDEVTVEHDFWASSVKNTPSDVIKSGYKSVNLTAIDIANFITKNFLPNDFVVVKMDIEGAEWDVVPHMIKMNAGINIDYLLVEWHWHLATEEQKNQLNQTMTALLKQGTQVPAYDSYA